MAKGTIVYDIEEADLEDVRTLLADLKQRARETDENGKLILHSVYVDLLGVVSPILQRLEARTKREALASERKAHKVMRKAAREAKAASQPA
jgi:hypothetical protein